MRDLIWTLILIWAAYRIFSMFRIGPAAGRQPRDGSAASSPMPPVKDDMSKKEALKKHLNTEGEYVDFEEIR
jgi:hypothetical protein